MSDIQDLIDAANRLCERLDESAQNEKKYCDVICEQLEKSAWECQRLTNDLKEIRQYVGR